MSQRSLPNLGMEEKKDLQEVVVVEEEGQVEGPKM